MKIKTHLISGAGNIFHIAFGSQDAFADQNISEAKKKELTRLACIKNKADGFIFLQKPNQFEWFFYNNDGSNAEMCGNATRCVGYYIKNILNESANQWNLKTRAGMIEIKSLSPESYQIAMTPIRVFSSLRGGYYDTGVPHLILEIENFEEYPQLRKDASLLRFDPEFQPRGTNVTYVKFGKDKTKLQAVSFERGVEDFTAACGTGAMAAAMYNLIKRGSDQTQVEMPGGTLMMDLSDLQKPKMTGPAVLLGKFEYEIGS